MKKWVFTAMALSSLMQCSRPTALSGGSTITDNAKVSVSVFYINGLPAKSAAVRMRTHTYVQPVGTKPDSLTRYDTVTDDSGRFSIDSVKKGEYRIEINDEKTSAVLIPCTVKTTHDSITLGTDTLRRYSTISGKVDSLNTKNGQAFVQVVGLERLVPVDSAGSFLIPDLPASTYQIKVISPDTAVKPTVVDSIKTAPDSVTHVIDTVKTTPIDTANPIVGQWAQANGPYGGTITSFVVNGSTLFAGTYGGGVFVTTDNGNNWTSVNTGIHPNAVISSFGMAGTAIIAGADYGVYVSINNGATWTEANRGQLGGLVPAFAYSPIATGGGTLFAIGEGGPVAFSMDNGFNWTQTNASVSAGGQALVFMPNQSGGGYLFAGTTQGVYLSQNNGDSWLAVNNGLIKSGMPENVQVLAVNGSDIIAGTRDGMFHSLDTGASWTEINTGLSQWAMTDIRAIAARDSAVFVGTYYDGVYYSATAGSTWSAANTGLFSAGTNVQVWALSLSLNSTGGDNLFAGTNVGAFISIDHGAHWASINNGLLNIDVVDFAAIGDMLFAASDYGVYRCLDNGSTWTPINSGLINAEPKGFVRSLAVSTTGGGASTLFAGTLGKGVFYSTDNGDHWIRSNSGLTDTNITFIAVRSGAAGGSYLFAGTSSGLFVSVNSGASWSAANNNLPAMTISALSVTPNKTGGNTVYVGAQGAGIYLSTDNGVSWTEANNGLTSMSVNDIVVAAVATGGSIVFAGTEAGVFISVNDGATWSGVNTGLTDTLISALAVYGNDVFAATRSGKVFVSANNGAQWTSVGAGLGNISIQTLFAGPKVAGVAHLFAAGQGGGVWMANLK